MSAQNVELVRSCYAAFARGDIKAILGAMDSAIEFRLAENSPYYSGGPLVGPQQVLDNVFSRIPQDWDGFRIVTGGYHDAGDVVVMEGRYAGTYRTTGKATNAQVVHIWTIRNGKLAKFQQYVDTAELREVTGNTAKTLAAS